MTVDVEERLRAYFADATRDVPAVGPGLDVMPTRAFAAPRPRRAPWLAAAAAVLVAAAGGAALWSKRASDGATSADTGPSASAVFDTIGATSSTPDTFAPVVTAALPNDPALLESPITVPAGAALAYWRFLPDVDLAWRETATGTELCWRSTAPSVQCVSDAFNSPAVTTIPVALGAVFVVRPALVAIEPAPTDGLTPPFTMDDPPVRVTAQLSDGRIVTAPVVVTGGDVQLYYARIALTDGVAVVSASSS